MKQNDNNNKNQNKIDEFIMAIWHTRANQMFSSEKQFSKKNFFFHQWTHNERFYKGKNIVNLQMFS